MLDVPHDVVEYASWHICARGRELKTRQRVRRAAPSASAPEASPCGSLETMFGEGGLEKTIEFFTTGPAGA